MGYQKTAECLSLVFQYKMATYEIVFSNAQTEPYTKLIQPVPFASTVLEVVFQSIQGELQKT